MWILTLAAVIWIAYRAYMRGCTDGVEEMLRSDRVKRAFLEARAAGEWPYPRQD